MRALLVNLAKGKRFKLNEATGQTMVTCFVIKLKKKKKEIDIYLGILFTMKLREQ